MSGLPHNPLARLSDEELDAAITAALDAAHTAPMAEYNLHADGTREIRNPTYAWADRTNEWMALRAERERRRSS